MAALHAHAEHLQRCSRLLARLPAQGEAPWRLGKTESNLFRERERAPRQRLDLREFNHVIEVDARRGWVDVEGGTPYDAIVDATLAEGVMPQVVPQLRSITAGGAVAGVGIEASSFRHGLVHHGLLELEALLPDGRVVVATAHNEHSALFHAFPNSYGTLGYALRVRLRTRPVRPHVKVEHREFDNAASAFEAFARGCDDPSADFVDGVVFNASRTVVSIGRFVDAAPVREDDLLEQPYYRSLLQRRVDYLSTRDFLWRWDADWFWCSKNFGLEHRWLRKLVGRDRLNSRTYTRWMRWNERLGLTQRWARLRGLHRESVIQDIDIPLEHATTFLSFLLREIGIVPIWLCPLRSPVDDRFTLFPLRPQALYVNFGFWDGVETDEAHEPGHFNRLIERETSHLGGIKSLYSDSFFSRAEFDAIYGGAAYAPIKRMVDPQHRLPDLYDKCVRHA